MKVGSAKVIEFVKADSQLAKEVNKEYTVIKETEREKYRPSKIVELMNDEGFSKFNMHHHTALWKSQDAKAGGKNYGVEIEKQWYWYEGWLAVVRQHCEENRNSYT